MRAGSHSKIAPAQRRQDDCNARRAGDSLQQLLALRLLVRRGRVANIFRRRWLPVREHLHQAPSTRRSCSAVYALDYFRIACLARWIACFSNAFGVWVSSLLILSA